MASHGSGIVDRLDDAIETLFDPLRGCRGLDAAAAAVSNLSDYGVLWAAIAMIKARRGGTARRRALGALALSGSASFLVNAAIKSTVGRQRPRHVSDGERPGPPVPVHPPPSMPVHPPPSMPVHHSRPVPVRRPRPVPVRRPRSSSFPSGHTLAAACTAMLLAEGPVERAAFLALTLAVGTSRLQLGDHHGSDVIGGAVIGVLLGAAIRTMGRSLLAARTSRRSGMWRRRVALP